MQMPVATCGVRGEKRAACLAGMLMGAGHAGDDIGKYNLSKEQLAASRMPIVSNAAEGAEGAAPAALEDGLPPLRYKRPRHDAW